MIIYGTRATLLKTAPIIESCPHCGNPTVNMNVFQRYVHIFWIPMFPIDKTGVSECQHCRQVLRYRQMPQSLKTGYQNVKTGTTLPWWTFIGLIIIAGIVIAGAIGGSRG